MLPSPPVTRRAFVGGVAATAVSASWGRRRGAADVVLRGGLVVDGSGMPGYEADVVIRGAQVVRVERGSAERGAVELDVRGQVVAPGFVDLHSHGDGTLFDDPRAESLIRQGITTIVVGQDGGGTADVAGLFARVRNTRPAVHVAAMVGLGSVRGVVVGRDDRPATEAELQRMEAMVEAALAAGACGASSGLEYTPGAFASAAELARVCRPLAARRLPYATHLRNEDDHLLDAIDEAIGIARAAGCPLQVSHLKTQGPRNWSALDEVFRRFAAARTPGLDVAFDRYPYVAYQTGLTNLFPVWSRDGGTPRFFSRLEDPAVAPRIREETLAKVALIGGWGNVMIAGVRVAEDQAALGQRMDVVARSADSYETAVAMLRRNQGEVGMVGFAMSEANLERILAHPLGMVASDGGAFATSGPARRGHPHPRGLGSFPRVLGRYVRERKALTLEDAVRKMTALPASRARLPRGRIATGAAADLVVFDPDTVADRATFEAPFQYPVGIRHVVVAGTLALREGERSAPPAGGVLHPEG